MQYDEIIDCPKTGGRFCYRVQVTPEISTYMSLSSGYMTNSLMKEGEEFFEIQMETLPELHKDIAWKDPNTGLTWIPNTINEKGIGMVFADGTDKNNWGWAAVKSIKIPDHEKRKHPIPGKPGEYLEYKMDMDNMRHFHERDYIEALDYVGLLTPQKT